MNLSATSPMAHCTILSTNYLPKALALAESLRRHEGATLRILVIDAARPQDLPSLPADAPAELLSTAVLGLDEAELHRLAMIYDLVEFATAVKPLLLKALLVDAERAVYLDPDTYLTAPLAELTPALDESTSGIALTPHFLTPIPADLDLSEGHLLTFGVYNLGFCAVDRRAVDFLDWWWGHLRRECLFDFLSGLFVDQKWVDLGATLFSASALRHPGYNVGFTNLHERDVEQLRLFHFHAFDPATPELLTTRTDFDDARWSPRTRQVVLELSKEYAEVLSGWQERLPAAPPYPYASDTRGRRIPRQLRRAFRTQLEAGVEPPSPFVAEQAAEFDRWRRRAWGTVAKALAGDAAKSARCAMPEEYARIAGRFPALATRLRSRFRRGDGIWG